MLEKLSVKKPFTILVAVIMVIILGVVSVTGMTMDLLPGMTLPYMIVVTTYPGASPERVESDVTAPLESSLGTVSGVANVYSSSAENYSMVQLEFEEDTDMDSAMVKVSSAVQQTQESLPESCGTPTIIELSMDMVATMQVTVSREGYDIYEISSFVEETILPYIERQNGVASVSTTGLVEKTIVVQLDKEKIDDVNARLLMTVNDALADAKKQLDDAERQVKEGKEQLSKAQASFGSTMAGTIFDGLSSQLQPTVAQLKFRVDELKKQVDALAGSTEDEDAADRLEEISKTLAELSQRLENGEQISPEELAEIAAQLGMTVEQLQAILDRMQQQPTLPPLPTAAPTAEPTATPTAEPTATPTAEPTAAPTPEPGGNDNDTTARSGLAAHGGAALTNLGGGTGLTLTALSNTTASPLPTATPEATPEATAGPSLDEMLEQTSGALGDLSAALDGVPQLLDGLESMMGMMTQAQLEAAVGFSTAQTQLANAEAQLTAARAQYESQKDTALASANLDQLLSVSTLSQLIYAQNFAMPAGYIDDAEDNTWLLKVGEEFETAEDIAGALLVSMDGVGDVRLEDVAEVTVIDNAGESYARMNGEQAVVLSIFKGSTVGTNEVSRNCYDAFEQLEEKYEGTNFVVLMDQGDYITLILDSVLTSMGLGALLAVVVLALFLKDVLPTLVVAISIPLSVLFSLVLMYFTDISLNMMSLSGLALGIGMLVDNSVVVMENIYRLRNRGVSAPRAAVQGTKQVAAAITSSTLTTVCVFMPLLFTSGMVRQLLMPLGLTIGYCLMASLVVAMTVVPATASTLLRNTKPKPHPWFDKVMEVYGRTLNWCLDHKLLPLVGTVALLAVCIWRVVTMGIVLIPDMTANSISISVTTEEGMTREESYAAADKALDAMLQVPGITDVGLMGGGSSSGLMGGMGGMGGGSSAYGSYSGYITLPSSTSGKLIQQMVDGLNGVDGSADGYKVSASASGLGEMTALMGSGLSLSVYGNDLDDLLEASEGIMEVVAQVEGYTNISNGIEDGDPTIHLVIDRDAAMAKGLTVAQIYMEIATRMTTSATATSVSVDGAMLDVRIENNTDPLTLEKLMEIPFEVTAMGEMGAAETSTVLLGEIAHIEHEMSVPAVERENQTRYVTVTAGVAEGENATLLSRKLNVLLDEYVAAGNLPDGCSLRMGGESDSVMDMVWQMCKMLAMGCAFVYLVMVAQFQSLLSPFIVLLTVPLAFTGGMIGLMLSGQPLSLLSLMGFVVLMGTVVNNGIVYVDYVNQLRMGGMDRRSALIATGKTRMRPILMTAMTTILAMVQMIFADDMGGQLGGGMAIVIVGGLTYATFMTLYIIPVLYDIMFKKAPLEVDLGDENLDDVPDDAAEFIAAALAEKAAREAAQPQPKPEM